MKKSKSDWIERMRQRNISLALLPNIDLDSVEEMHAICEEMPDLFRPMMGLHPCDVKGDYETVLKTIYNYLERSPDTYCGVGEIGLDYHWDLTFQKEQKIALETQFEWAISWNKAVSIHSRKSNHDTIPLITQYSKKGLKGVMHCFSGSIQEAHKIIDAGFYLGIGGVLTYPKSDLQEIIKEIDLKHLVLETDAPFLSPVPHRGKPNEPSYIYDIARHLAQLKNMSIEEVGRITTQNAIELFQL